MKRYALVALLFLVTITVIGGTTLAVLMHLEGPEGKKDIPTVMPVIFFVTLFIVYQVGNRVIPGERKSKTSETKTHNEKTGKAA